MRKFQEKALLYKDPDESESGDDGGDSWGEDPDGGGYDDHDVDVPDSPSGYGVAE